MCTDIDDLVQAQDRLNFKTEEKIQTQPVIFIGHGNPMVAIEFDEWNEKICQFLDGIPRPSAIIVLSAHWLTDNSLNITSSEFPEQIYDFFGFPNTLYQLTYPCEGDPQLADEIATILSDFEMNIILDRKRGLDHGVWIPLYAGFPNADIPVVQISIPKEITPKKLLDLGSALSHLRRKGVLLIGSGNLVHNLALAKLQNKYADVDHWAKETDEWLKQQIYDLNINDLINFEKNLPNREHAFRSTEHFLPLFFVLGARLQKDHLVDIFEGFHYGNISMRAFAFMSNY